MANPTARELKRKWELAQAWEAARTVPRAFGEDVPVPGIGLRRVQVIVVASFSPSFAWEIREGGGSLRLYRSDVVGNTPRGLGLLGYDELEIRTGELRQHLDRLWTASISSGPTLNGMACLDGVGYELALFGDMHSQGRFKWWEEGPEQWRPMIDVVMEMIEAFKGARVRSGSAEHGL
jgi:hypothetical protein